MKSLDRPRRLVQLRTLERREAANAVADANALVQRANDQVSRLTSLSIAISPGIGLMLGSALSGAGEYLTRLAEGHLATVRRLERQTLDVEEAQKRFAICDSKVRVAERVLDNARRRAENEQELRTARCRPALRRQSATG